MSCAERKRFVKKCGLLTSEHFGDNKQKISPNLAKRTDFLVHKAQVLVGVTGFEPAASTSQTLKCRFFPYSTRLFEAFASEINAFVCSYKHCFHVVRNRRWSTLWSKSKLHIFSHLTRAICSDTEVAFLLLPLYHKTQNISSPLTNEKLHRCNQR